jgi:ankyrin repeat protein
MGHTNQIRRLPLLKRTLRTAALSAALALLSLGALPSLAAQPETLSDLIRAGNREAVLAAITSPAVDVNAVELDGSTALMWATYKVDRDLVRALLKRGAKVNVKSHYGSSALTEAVKLSDVELVRLLLDAHADPDSANQDGQTALMLAASLGALDVAKLLIQKGARVNAVETYRGQTALMWAAAEKRPELVELLLAHHADFRIRAKYDDWPRQITSEPRAQFRATGGFTALLYATRSGCLACVQALIRSGADVNQPNPDGITPLINAADNRNFDIAMFLLDHGANPNVWDMTGRTPLYVAVDMNSIASRGFLGFGGPLPPLPKDKATAMDVVNRLLTMGVDPNHELTRMRPNAAGRGRFGEYMLRGGTTALMVAALGYDDAAIKALLAHGADVDLSNVFRITPMMAAAGMEGSGRGAGPGEGDVQTRAIKTIDLLVQGGANINARITNSHTHTSMLTAYNRGTDHEGQTALFSAAVAGWDRVVKDLLARGANPTVRDAQGRTALEYVRQAPAIPPPTGGPPVAAEGRKAAIAILETATQQSRSGGGAAPSG